MELQLGGGQVSTEGSALPREKISLQNRVTSAYVRQYRFGSQSRQASGDDFKVSRGNFFSQTAGAQTWLNSPSSFSQPHLRGIGIGQGMATTARQFGDSAGFDHD